MFTADFDFPLPPSLIAQSPAPTRDASRMMVVDRATKSFDSTLFQQLPDRLRPGDLLVFNNSRVFPARLRGSRPNSGGQVEFLLLEPAPTGGWWTMARPGKRLRPDSTVLLHTPPHAPVPVQVREKNADGHCRLEFPPNVDPLALAESHGEMPLPPYIARSSPLETDRERYQTIYARESGSVAAPTAGLHFTPAVLDRLRQRGIELCEVTLHVGVGTFAPVKAERLTDHVMHSERFEIPTETAERIRAARREGRRVIAVGTTSLRVLESSARAHAGDVAPGPGRTRLFLHPPADFLVVDGLLTNFHLPKSTLLMLVSAFAAPGALSGRELVLAAYAEAVAREYRFFSYGDAMLLL